MWLNRTQAIPQVGSSAARAFRSGRLQGWAGAIGWGGDSASEIPPEIQTREIGTSIDYSEVTIRAAKYLLPLHATILMKTDQEQVRNELIFQNYRKFGAESSLILGGDEQPSAPKP